MPPHRDLRKTIMLLDDHPLVRGGVQAALSTQGIFNVIGSYGRGPDLLSAMRSTAVDIVVTDFSLGHGEVDGMNFIRALRTRFPDVKILVLTSHDNLSTQKLALQAGADGFIGKGRDPEELISAVFAVLSGRAYPAGKVLLPSDAKDKMIGAQDTHSMRTLSTYGAALSSREYEVLRCCLEGMSTSEISRKFSRQMNTISTQKRSAYRKLGIRNDSELFKLRELVERSDAAQRSD